MSQTVSSIDHHATDTRPLTRVFSAAGKILRNLLAHVRHEARIRGEIAKAQALDDYILADIALKRREIKHAVRSGRWAIERVVRDD